MHTGRNLAFTRAEGTYVNRRTYRLIAGLVAAGVGAWLWRNRTAAARPQFEAQRGTVILDNTPRASSLDGNI